MKCYNYNPQTFEYMGESIMQPNPLKEGEFFLPLYATKTPPPSLNNLKENETLKYNIQSDSWEIVCDYRGKTVIETDENGVPIKQKIINNIGESIIGKPTEPPPQNLLKPFWNGKNWSEGASLEEYKDFLIEQIKKEIKNKLSETDEITYRCRECKDAGLPLPIKVSEYKKIIIQREKLRQNGELLIDKVKQINTLPEALKFKIVF